MSIIKIELPHNDIDLIGSVGAALVGYASGRNVNDITAAIMGVKPNTSDNRQVVDTSVTETVETEMK